LIFSRREDLDRTARLGEWHSAWIEYEACDWISLAIFVAEESGFPGMEEWLVISGSWLVVSDQWLVVSDRKKLSQDGCPT
jgi:hypothetical protein